MGCTDWVIFLARFDFKDAFFWHFNVVFGMVSLS